MKNLGKRVKVINDNHKFSLSLGSLDLTGYEGVVTKWDDVDVTVDLCVNGKIYKNINFDFDEVRLLVD